MFISHNEEIWESVSDLMTGLMMVFLFVAISFIMMLGETYKHYEDTRKEIMDALIAEFPAEEMKGYGAKFDPENMTVVFEEPKTMFDLGESDVKPEYQKVLIEFWPRYIKVLTDEKFLDQIQEVRIEGNASYEKNDDFSYMRDMSLSQQRATNVLQFVYYLPSVEPQKGWMQEHVSANGLSYSQARAAGSIGSSNDRKVQFRIRTKEEELRKIYGEVIYGKKIMEEE